MKTKRVLKKVKKDKVVRYCWFCGSQKGLERHHVIPVQIGGKHLQNNKIDICKDCHPKLHNLLDPVISYLVLIIESFQVDNEKQMLPIGFIRTNNIHKK